MLPLCAERDVAYLAFSPLAGGWLTGKYRRGQAFPAGSRMTQRPEPYDSAASATRRSTRSSALEALGRERDSSMAGSRSPGCSPTIASPRSWSVPAGPST